MPYLGYLLAQALKAGDTIAQAITSAANFVTKVGGSVVDLSPSVEALKSPSKGSAVFDGASDYIQTNGLNDYSGYTGLTISTWMYSGDLTSNKTIASNWGAVANSDYGWLIFTGQFVDYKISFLQSANGTNYNRLDNSTNLNENQWYYVTCVWESGSAKIYIDGNLDGSDTSGVPTSIYGTDYPTLIGADADGSGGAIIRRFNGNLANFAIWSRALSASEIRSVMNKSYDDLNASETKGLTSWYALDDISGSTVPDSHGNYNGTAN